MILSLKLALTMKELAKIYKLTIYNNTSIKITVSKQCIINVIDPKKTRIKSRNIWKKIDSVSI